MTLGCSPCRSAFILLSALVIAMLLGCNSLSAFSAPRLDLSDETHAVASLQRMENALPPEEHHAFEEAVQILVTAMTQHDISAWARNVTMMSLPARPLTVVQLNGMTAHDIMAKAREISP